MNASIMILYLYFQCKNVPDYHRSSKIKQNFYEILCRIFHSPSVIKMMALIFKQEKKKSIQKICI